MKACPPPGQELSCIDTGSATPTTELLYLKHLPLVLMIRALSALTSTVLALALRWCSLDVNASACLGRRGTQDGAPAPRVLPTRLFKGIATVISEFAMISAPGTCRIPLDGSECSGS